MKIFNHLIKELEQPSESKEIGKGWLSGVLALVIAMICFLVVLCLNFPKLLTIESIRNSLNFEYIQQVLLVLLTFSFLLASVSLVLRELKVLGSGALFVIILTLWLKHFGTTNISSPIEIGLDWFVLNLLISSLLFIPFERRFARLTQSAFRFEWKTDLLYFFIGSVLVQSLTLLTMLPAQFLLKTFSLEATHSFISSQHFMLQLLEVMLITDFVQYWVHRMFHEIPFLWKFHAIHHSAEKMDWLASSRMHIMEIILLRGITVIPIYLLGFDTSVVMCYLVVVYVYSTYIHANLRFDIESLKPFIVTPRFHHWHHGIEKEAINVNYAIHFPFIDKIFGSYYMPKGKWPEGYGVKQIIPKGYLSQFRYPFK